MSTVDASQKGRKPTLSGAGLFVGALGLVASIIMIYLGEYTQVLPFVFVVMFVGFGLGIDWLGRHSSAGLFVGALALVASIIMIYLDRYVNELSVFLVVMFIGFTFGIDWLAHRKKKT